MEPKKEAKDEEEKPSKESSTAELKVDVAEELVWEDIKIGGMHKVLVQEDIKIKEEGDIIKDETVDADEEKTRKIRNDQIKRGRFKCEGCYTILRKEIRKIL